MKTKTLAFAIAAVAMSSSIALGDVNVVNPAPNPSPTPPPPPSSTTIVQPVQPVQPVQQVPPVQAAPAPAPAPRTQKVVEEQVEPPHNYMATVALSALMGGVAGLLVGGAIYYLGNDQPARNIGYWTAGGVILGAGVGVVQIVVQEDRAERAVGFADPAPTYRLALLRMRF